MKHNADKTKAAKEERDLARAKESRKTLLFHASQGNQKAKDALTKKGKK